MIGSFSSVHFNLAQFQQGRQEPLVSVRSLTCLFINILSLGLYTTVESLYKGHKLTQMNLGRSVLDEQAKNLLKKWTSLEDKLNQFQHELAASEYEQGFQKQDLSTLQGRIVILKNSLTDKAPHSVEKSIRIKQILLACIQSVVHLLANLLTVGVYGTYQSYTLRNRMAYLEAKNIFVKKQLNDCEEYHKQTMERKIANLQFAIKLKEESNVRCRSEQGKLCREYVHYHSKYESLISEQKNLQLQHNTLVIEKQRLDQRLDELKLQIQNDTRDIENLRKEKHEGENQLNSLTEHLKELGSQLVKAQQKQQGVNKGLISLRNKQKVELTKENRLKEDLKSLDQGSTNLDQQDYQLLGRIPSKYIQQADIYREVSQQREADPEREEVKALYEDPHSQYAILYNDKKNFPELMKTAFEHAFDSLVNISTTGRKIHFNKSSKLWNPNTTHLYHTNLSTLYRFISLEFLKGSKLVWECHGYFLKLNQLEGDEEKGLKIASSCPDRIKTYKRNANGDRKTKIAPCFSHVSPLLPNQQEHPDLIYGIDPVNAWVLERRLSQVEKGHLFNLLMESIIADNHPELVATRQFMQQGDPERVRVVQIAYELISEMAFAMRQTFEPLLKESLIQKADDNRSEPFLKLLEGSSEGLDNEFIECNPDCDSFEKNMEDLNSSFANYFFDTLYLHKNVLSQLTRNQLKHPKSELISTHLPEVNSDALYFLDYQYHRFTSNPRTTLTSLLTKMLVKADLVTDENIRFIKYALIQFLENNAAEFAKDLQNSNMNLKDYKTWLLDSSNNNNPNLKKLEIKLFTRVAGIQIAVFQTKEAIKLSQQGLVIPAKDESYYGPRTKETLFLYHDTTNDCYQALYPKIQEQVVQNNPDIVEIDEHCKQLSEN